MVWLHSRVKRRAASSRKDNQVEMTEAQLCAVRLTCSDPPCVAVAFVLGGKRMALHA